MAEQQMITTNLTGLAGVINKTSTEHGFWPNDRDRALDSLDVVFNAMGRPDEGGSYAEEIGIIRRYIEAQQVRNMGEMLMLATSELAEALEEDRSGNDPIWLKHETSCESLIDNPAIEQMACSCNPKPEGLLVELADCIIRCLDTMFGVIKREGLSLDIDDIVLGKMAYNSTRPHKHGKSY